MTHRLAVFTATLALVAACAEPPVPPGTAPGSPGANPARAIDSAIPREEALRRFRQEIPPVDSLTGGATSRDALVRGFIEALERRDTVALRQLVMNRREFAWVYYPTTAQGLPPYDLAPALLWFTLDTRSRLGIVRALQERAGRPLGYLDYRCPDTAVVEGENRIWGPCLVRREEGGAVIEEHLFASIVERHGRFKFVSLANGLD